MSMPIKYKSGYKYVLQETYATKISLKGYFAHTDYITLDVSGTLVLKGGYAWDGATLFPDLECLKRPSLIHDALCQLIRLGVLKEECLPQVHRVLKELVEEDITEMGLTEKAYLLLPEIIYNALVFLKSFGKGTENPLRIAPDRTKRDQFKSEIIKQLLDFRNYI